MKTFAKARLVVALLALAAWVGYVAYQALAFGRFTVVSHSQLLISTLDVIAEVKADADGRPDPVVRVVEVHWPERDRNLVGRDLTVVNLNQPLTVGFEGAGKYILPLVKGEGDKYRIAGLPRSPGFDRIAYFIYPDTPLARSQLDAIPKPTVGSVGK